MGNTFKLLARSCETFFVSRIVEQNKTKKERKKGNDIIIIIIERKKERKKERIHLPS
jgi:hypothetical protein